MTWRIVPDEFWPDIDAAGDEDWYCNVSVPCCCCCCCIAGIRRQLRTQVLNDSAAQCSQGSSWVSGLLVSVCWRMGAWSRGGSVCARVHASTHPLFGVPQQVQHRSHSTKQLLQGESVSLPPRHGASMCALSLPTRTGVASARACLTGTWGLMRGAVAPHAAFAVLHCSVRVHCHRCGTALQQAGALCVCVVLRCQPGQGQAALLPLSAFNGPGGALHEGASSSVCPCVHEGGAGIQGAGGEGTR